MREIKSRFIKANESGPNSSARHLVAAVNDSLPSQQLAGQKPPMKLDAILLQAIEIGAAFSR